MQTISLLTVAANRRYRQIQASLREGHEQYDVSRTFVYLLRNGLKKAGEFIFGESGIDTLPCTLREKSIEAMVSLRMEGGCSIEGTSTFMKRHGLELSSTG
ncbi:MAG: hypothetical protein WCK65_14880, partial [Rhodospirillaceae bacterium]